MKIIFQNGRIKEQESDDINKIVCDLKSQRDYIHSLKIDWVIEYFDELSKYWKNNKELENKVGGSLKHLADFIKKENLISMLNFALRGNYKILDGFVDLNQPKYIYHCQPQGLVVHWLSGNVPLLSLYSIFQAMLTKNISLIKASSRAYKELLILLESLNSINTPHIKGNEILNTICVVLIDRDDLETQTKISMSADVRIAWGGHEAIKTISSLKKNIFCQDIIFGPKYSYGIIDKESLKNYKKIAQRVAFDICTFDQYACSSPHTIFVQESDKISAKDFAKELAKNMDIVTTKFIPKGEEDQKKKIDIFSVRTKYCMVGEVFSSKNTDWTVIYSDEPGLFDACFSRVIHVKPIKNILDLNEYNSRKIQSLGTSISCNEREKMIDSITFNGIDRCPRFGNMTLYESPWDGMFPVDRLVRWVALNKEEKCLQNSNKRGNN